MATLVGYGLLLLSLPSLLTCALPDVRGSVPPGGMLGSLVSADCGAASIPSAQPRSVALLLTALFMTHDFLSVARMRGQPVQRSHRRQSKSWAYCRRYSALACLRGTGSRNACASGWRRHG